MKMKKIISLVLILCMVFSLTACGNVNLGELKDSLGELQGALDELKNLDTDELLGSLSGTDTDGKTDGDKTGNDDSGNVPTDLPSIGEMNQTIKDAFGDMSEESDPYHFPKITNMQEWPGAEIWEQMGMINLKPAVCNEGYIYNDGNAYIEDFVFAFTAECNSDDASFQELATQLWDAGYRGMDAGGGIIKDASEQALLMSENPNYLYYDAFYEQDGTMLQIELQKSAFNEKLWVSVSYAPSLKTYTQYPEISWPADLIRELTGATFEKPDGTMYGIADKDAEDGSPIDVYIDNVTEETFQAYVQNIMDGKVSGISSDGNYDFYTYSIGNSTLEFTNYSFWSDTFETDPNPVYINLTFVEGVMNFNVDYY